MQIHPHADDRAGRRGPDLHEVAQLVHEPQAAPADPVRAGLESTDKGVVGEAGPQGMAGDQAPHDREVIGVGIEGQLLRRRRRVGELAREGCGRSAVLLAGPSSAALAHEGMRPRRGRQDVTADRRSVVRAQQSPWSPGHEGDVQQGLVAFTLVDLGGVALREDRLAHSPHAGARRGVAGHELPPDRNDPRRVAADLRHVGEVDVPRRRAESPLETRDLRAVDDDEDRVEGFEAFEDERRHALEELVDPLVEKRFVAELVERRMGRVLRVHAHAWAFLRLPAHEHQFTEAAPYPAGHKSNIIRLPLPSCRMANAKDLVAKTVTSVHETLYRLSKGRVGGRGYGMPVVILTTTGRKSGQRRTTMLTSPVQDGDTVVLVASYGGDDRHPAWYLNLRKNPDVELTWGSTTKPMRARVASKDEKAELWPRVVAVHKGYGQYQTRTTRDIPLVILEPIAP